MPVRGIYAITDPVLLPGQRLYSGVEQALAGGIRLIQYRDKAAAWDQQLRRTKELMRICQDYEAQLIVNDNVNLAYECGATGVHLGQGDESIAVARQQLGVSALIGITCHDQLALARLAHQQGASYVAFGRFFPSATKPEAPCAPIGILQEALHQIPCPVVAIGGLSSENMQKVICAGAHAVALCNSLFADHDINLKARRLVELFHEQSTRN